MSSSPTSFHGHKRPLPPPLSREAVLLQAREISVWTVVGSGDDMEIASPAKRIRLHESIQPQEVVLHTGSRDRLPYPVIPDNQRLTSLTDRIDLQTGTMTSKKSLFPSQSYLTKVREQNKALEEALREKSRYKSFASNQQARDIATETLASDTSKPDLPAHLYNENDQEEALRLARMTNNISVGPEGINCPAVFTQTPSVTQITSSNELARQRLEAACQARSRFLRLRNLARRSGDYQGSWPGSSSKSSDSASNPDSDSVSESSYNTAPDTEVLNTEASQVHRPISIDTNQEQEYATLRNASEVVSNLRPAVSPTTDELFEKAREADGGHGDNWYSEPKIPEKATSGVLLNPASRAAAEHYRTQDRHLVDVRKPQDASLGRPQDWEMRESRLRRFTSQTFESTANPQFRPLANVTNTPTRTNVPTRTPLPDLPLNAPSLALAANAPDVEPNLVTAVEDTTVQESQVPQQAQVPVVDPIESFNKGRPLPDSFPPLRLPKVSSNVSIPSLTHKPSTPLAKDLLKYPKEPRDLTLPKQFHLYDEELQATITECETLKERERDLQAVISTFEQIGYLASLRPMSALEFREHGKVTEYAKAVVDHGLSGKKARKRILDICGNMKTRIQRCSSEREMGHRPALEDWLPADRSEYIRQMLSDNSVKLEAVRQLRQQQTQRYYKTKKSNHRTRQDSGTENPTHASVTKVAQPARAFSAGNSDRLSALPDGAEIVLPRSSEPKQQEGQTPTERRRNAQYAAFERREKLLQSKLRLFEKPSASDNTLDSNAVEDGTQGIDNDSDISEEEEGAHLFNFAHLSLSSQPEPVSDNTATLANQLADSTDVQYSSNTQPAAPPSTHGVSSQAFDEVLAARMKEKHRQREAQKSQERQMPISNQFGPNQEIDTNDDLLRAEVQPSADLEFGDVDDDDTDGRESEFQDICGLTYYRYAVTATFQNFPGYDDGADYTFKTYLQFDKASESAEEVKTNLKQQYKLSLGPKTDPVEHEEHKTALDINEYIVTLGLDGRTSFRVWIEKGTYQPSQEAYENARVRRACHAKPVYTVYWEHTVTRKYAPLENAEDNLDQTQTRVDDDSNSGNTETTPNPTSTPDPNNNVDTIDEELFGPDPPEVIIRTLSPAPTCIRNKIQVDALRFYTNIANANRHAKEVFMMWFRDHLPGNNNWSVIHDEDYQIEQQLKAYGNMTRWDHEESFDVVVDESEDDDDDGDGSGGDTSKRKLIQNDHYRVWVEAKQVLGPAN